MFALGVVPLDSEDLQAAEFEHEDAHQQQDQEGTAGTVLDEAARDVPDAEVAQQTVHAEQTEDAQELELREGQAREQVGPTVPSEEVLALGRGRQDADRRSRS